MSSFTASRPASVSPEPGLRRRVLSHSPTMMVVENEMERDWAGARHRHPHEQAIYVVSGRLRFSRGDELLELTAGSSLIVPGGVEHQAWAIEPCVVVDVFTPSREDYL